MAHHLKGGLVVQKIVHNGNGQRLKSLTPDHALVEKNFDLADVDEQRLDKEIVPAGEITIQVTGVAEPSFFGISPQIPFSETRTIPLKL